MSESDHHHPQIEITPEELERAKVGVEKYKKVLEDSNLRERIPLLVGKTAQMFRSMCLGIKPLMKIDEHLLQLSRVSLPPGIKRLADTAIYYDEELVAAVIQREQNMPAELERHGVPSVRIFSDYDKKMSLNDYLTRIFSKDQPERVGENGLLHGYPRKAVVYYTSLSLQEQYEKMTVALFARLLLVFFIWINRDEKVNCFLRK